MHVCVHQHYCTDTMESPCDGLSCLQIGLSEEQLVDGIILGLQELVASQLEDLLGEHILQKRGDSDDNGNDDGDDDEYDDGDKYDDAYDEYDDCADNCFLDPK